MKYDREQFMAHFGQVFESSPWFAESVYERHGGKIVSAFELAAQFEAALRRAGPEEQLNLLRAHPELACAVREDLTGESRREQAAAGLDACSKAEFKQFEELNRMYRDRFGFPFIIAVAGLDRHQILSAFQSRINNEHEQEFQTALDEVCKIASVRITNALHERA
ncbi:MAG: 2-oxo-4-hydroxy-4-carboxy-5-ureidoimidazoline decarboxylase [Xanthomonadales bacterium]|nr:2-oxo-4-hydroxy-4-carboxy-5-ureidoimidazoline decarboxylase [Xanthomonadales bacterium]